MVLVQCRVWVNRIKTLSYSNTSQSLYVSFQRWDWEIEVTQALIIKELDIQPVMIKVIQSATLMCLC